MISFVTVFEGYNFRLVCEKLFQDHNEHKQERYVALTD